VAGGLQSQLRKYRLGPGESRDAEMTLPDGSTATLTPTLTLPEIVSRDFWDTGGITCLATAPGTASAEDFPARG